VVWGATAMMLSELKDVLMSVYMLKNEELATVGNDTVEVILIWQ
jgi:hypothetical protein